MMESQSGDESQSSIVENITHMPRNGHNLPLEPHFNGGAKAYIWLGVWLVVVWWILSRACESGRSKCHLDVRLRMHNSSCVVDIVGENCRGYGSQSVVCHSGDGKENVSLLLLSTLVLGKFLVDKCPYWQNLLSNVSYCPHNSKLQLTLTQDDGTSPPCSSKQPTNANTPILYSQHNQRDLKSSPDPTESHSSIRARHTR